MSGRPEETIRHVPQTATASVGCDAQKAAQGNDQSIAGVGLPRFVLRRTALALPASGSPPVGGYPFRSCASGRVLDPIVGGRRRYGGVMFDVTPFRRVDGAVVFVVYRGDW